MNKNDKKRKPNGYWNCETCCEESKKYKSRKEFQVKCGSAYKVALKNGWLDDYTWLITPPRQVKWNRESCYKEAQKYKSRTKFARSNISAYDVARVNGWLDDYTWLITPPRQVKWNRESCYKEAQKYKSRKEFQVKCGSAYKVALKNNWLDNYTWFINTKKPSGYWNYDTCYSEARKYNRMIDFEKKSNSAYNVARKKEWLNDYTWFEKGKYADKNIYVVYCYKDNDTNSIYIGLTSNINKRHWQHCNGYIKHNIRKYDTVYKFYHSIKKEIPKPIILKKELYAENAKTYENYYVDLYKKEGLNVLNLAKPGSLGAFPKWTKEMCYTEALKYNKKIDFQNNANGAYRAAVRYGWIDDYTWFISRIKWNYETCYQEAQKYKSRTKFARSNQRAYLVALKKGWLNDYNWFIHSKS